MKCINVYHYLSTNGIQMCCLMSRVQMIINFNDTNVRTHILQLLNANSNAEISVSVCVV